MSEYHRISGDFRSLAEALQAQVACVHCERDDAMTCHSGDARAWCHRCARITGPVDLVLHHHGGAWAEAALEADALTPGILEAAGIDLDRDALPDPEAFALADRGREAAMRMTDPVRPPAARYLRARGVCLSGACCIGYRYVPHWSSKEMDGQIPQGHELREVALASGCWIADPELVPDRLRWQLGYDRILVAWRDRRGRVRGLRSRSFAPPPLTEEESKVADEILDGVEPVATTTPNTDDADEPGNLPAPELRWMSPRPAEGAARIWHHHASGALVVIEGVFDFAAAAQCELRCATTLGAQPSADAVQDLCARA